MPPQSPFVAGRLSWLYGLPVADIVPHAAAPGPWVPSRVLRAIVDEAGADPGRLEDPRAGRDHA